jgi:hypothetical protein
MTPRTTLALEPALRQRDQQGEETMTLEKKSKRLYEIWSEGAKVGYCELGRGSARAEEWRAAIYGKPIWAVNANVYEAAGQAIRELYGVC